jgi:hypothetical protein
MKGESNREIAREEKIDRATVGRILSQKEVVQTMAEQQSRLLSLGNRAIGVFEEALDCEDLGIAAATATKILEGTGVMNRRGLQGTIDDTKARHFDRSTKSDVEFALWPGEFVWPPDSLPPQSELKRQRRKPPKPELSEISTDESASDDHG